MITYSLKMTKFPLYANLLFFFFGSNHSLWILLFRHIVICCSFFFSSSSSITLCVLIRIWMKRLCTNCHHFTSIARWIDTFLLSLNRMPINWIIQCIDLMTIDASERENSFYTFISKHQSETLTLKKKRRVFIRLISWVRTSEQNTTIKETRKNTLCDHYSLTNTLILWTNMVPCHFWYFSQIWCINTITHFVTVVEPKHHGRTSGNTHTVKRDVLHRITMFVVCVLYIGKSSMDRFLIWKVTSDGCFRRVFDVILMNFDLKQHRILFKD